MKILRFVALGAIALTSACSSLPPADSAHIVLHGTRNHRLLTFQMPPGSDFTTARDSSGKRFPLQVDEDGVAMLLFPKAVSQDQLNLTLRKEGATKGIVRLKKTASTLQVSVRHRPILKYQAEPGDLPRPGIKPIFKRGGFLHPVYSPSGNSVTDSYATNHLHHHGIWFSWTKTEFQGRHPDFWNMGDGKGTVEFVELDKTQEGPVYAGFSSRHRYLDLTSGKPVSALEENWEVKVYPPLVAGRAANVFDLVCKQHPAGPDALKLPKYYYGGLGFRGREEWNGAAHTFFLTSEGETNRINGNATRGRWCYIGGMVNGRQSGIALLCHPSNFRAPQPMRLHPTEPFFCFAPSQLDDWEISRDYVSNYRFVVFDGKPNKEEIDGWWREYGEPVSMELVK